MSADPGWINGTIPTPDEWNSWWARKLDNNDPIIAPGQYLLLSGGTLTGSLNLVGGAFTGTYTGNHTYSGNVTFSGTSTVISGGTFTGTYAGAKTYTGALTLSGGGTFTGTFAGNHTYSGTITHTANYTNTFVGAALTVQGNVNIGGIVNIGPQGNANYIQINGSAGAVTIALTGTGTPANLVLRALGTGGVNMNSQNGSLLQIQDGGAGTAANSFLMIARPTGTYGTISLIDPTQGIMIGGTATAKLGFNAATPIAKPTLTGAKGSNAALTSVIAALVNYGLVIDTTTA